MQWGQEARLRGQTGIRALVGRLGSSLAKGEVGARSLYAALGQSETRSWYGEKGGNHHRTPLQALMVPHLGRNAGLAVGVAASSTSAPLSSCPHRGLCVLKVRGGSGKDLGSSFPGEPHSRASIPAWHHVAEPSALNPGSVSLPSDCRAAGAAG